MSGCTELNSKVCVSCPSKAFYHWSDSCCCDSCCHLHLTRRSVSGQLTVAPASRHRSPSCSQFSGLPPRSPSEKRKQSHHFSVSGLGIFFWKKQIPCYGQKQQQKCVRSAPGWTDCIYKQTGMHCVAIRTLERNSLLHTDVICLSFNDNLRVLIDENYFFLLFSTVGSFCLPLRFFSHSVWGKKSPDAVYGVGTMRLVPLHCSLPCIRVAAQCSQSCHQWAQCSDTRYCPSTHTNTWHAEQTIKCKQNLFNKWKELVTSGS